MGAAWPEVVANGIWPVGRIERVSLEQIAVPFASVEYGRPQDTDRYGITNQSYLINTSFYYVFQVDLVNDYEEVAAAKAEALEDYLLATGIATGQVLRVMSQDVTPNDPLMALVLDKAKPFYAGAVVAQILVGESNPP